MKQASYRERRHRALLAQPVDLTNPHNPNCATASAIARLVDEHDEGWAVDPRPCERCRISTVVTHEDAGVWICLFCGSHGDFDLETDR